MCIHLTGFTQVERTSAIIRHPLVVTPDTKVTDAIAQMSSVRALCMTGTADSQFADAPSELQTEARSSCVFVLENNQLIGIFTERDVVRLIAQKRTLTSLHIREVMTHPVISLRESLFTDLLFAINLLQQHHIRHLPLLDEHDRLAGLLTHESLRQISRPVDLLRLRLVAEIMTTQVICADPGVVMLDIARRMAKHRVSSVVLVQERAIGSETLKIPMGIVTERDLVQFQALNLDWETCQAQSVMSTPIFSVQPDDSLWVVQQLMEQHRIRRLLVTGSQGKLLGIVTQTSLLQALNSLELYRLAEILEAKVVRLEAEKVALLENYTAELEQQVAERTIALSNQIERGEALALQQAITYEQLQIELSERQKVLAQLQESEHRYASLAAAAPVGIFRADAQGHYIYVNERWCQIAGLTAETALGEGWQQGLHPDDRNSIVGTWWQSIQKNRPFQLEYRFQYPDGTVTWVYGQAVVEQGTEEGQIIGYVGTLTDITDRKQAELALECLNAELEEHVMQRTAELQEREARYRALMDGASDAILLSDLQGNLLEANQKAEELLGYTRTELSSMHFTQLHLPEDLSDRVAAFNQLANQQISQVLDARFRCQDGSVVPVDITASVIEIHGERIIQGILRDIRDRKQAELALRESEEKFRQLAEVVEAVFWILPLSRTERVYVSPAYERIWGKPCQDLYISVDSWEKAIHPLDRDRIMAAIPKQICGEYDEEYRIVRPDGEIRWIRDRAFPIKNSQGEVYRIAGIAEDITHHKHTEHQIQQQMERERLLREIGQRIRQSLDLQSIFDTACQEIRQVLQADRVGIFKFYPESSYDDGEFVAEAVVNDVSSVLAIRVHDHCFGKNYSLLYARGQYFVVDDIYCNGLESCHTSILAQFQVRANMVMPLLCGNELWGLLCIHQCRTPRQWQPSEIDLGQQLANQLAIAIQQATLYEQVQAELRVRQQAEARIAQQLRQQETLGAIVQQVRRSLDLHEILSTVTQQIKELLQGDRVIIFRLFPDGKSLIVEEAVSAQFSSLKYRHWDDEVWSQEILECYWQGKPRIVADVMNDVWTDCLVEYSQEGHIQSKIVAPILQDVQSSEAHRWVAPGETNKLWGILVIHACQQKRVWQESEAQLLQQIANQLAIAIQQANLFEQLQQELKERQQAQQQLTERNDELALSNQELARATRLKDEFLANMSHELRTPLNAILGMTEGLQEEVFGAINPQQIKALNTVEKSASHLLSLINDILDVAKIESGQIELDYLPVAVAPLCSSSLAFIKQQALTKCLQLETRIPANLPNLMVDERRIRQVLINLLTNAVKFTPEGGRITLVVSLLQSETIAQQQFIRVAITDSGIGIAPENINKLFRPFVQIDSSLNRQYTGTGLGLALVKQIVELHGGQVELTSELGVGSCFTIDLPCVSLSLLSEQDLPLAANSSSPVDPDHVASTLSPLILLVEDNEANISTVESYLVAKGYRLQIANNGEEAIALVQTEPPDLILMDIQMPGMDGLEAIHHIRCNPTLDKVPIIALTALAMPGDRERCLAAGANDYFSKPVRLKQLATVIQSLLPQE